MLIHVLHGQRRGVSSSPRKEGKNNSTSILFFLLAMISGAALIAGAIYRVLPIEAAIDLLLELLGSLFSYFGILLQEIRFHYAVAAGTEEGKIPGKEVEFGKGDVFLMNDAEASSSRKGKRKVPGVPLEIEGPPTLRSRDDFIDLPPSPPVEGEKFEQAGSATLQFPPATPNTAHEGLCESDLAHLEPNLKDLTQSLNDRFLSLSSRCQEEERIKIPFLESPLFIAELKSSAQSAGPAEQIRGTLLEKEVVLSYFEKEFRLKFELTFLLFRRKDKQIEKYRFKSDTEIAEAVNTFLSQKAHKTLAGSPSEEGLKDLTREFDLLERTQKRSNLYLELQAYFERADWETQKIAFS